MDDVLWALRELQSAMDGAAPAIARRAGLSSNDLAGLDVVASAVPGHHVGPADVARHLGITTASATAMVDRLVSSGHVQRHPHDSDRRRVVLRHTPKAENDLWQALGPLLGDLSAVLAGYSERDRATIAGFLREAADCWRHQAAQR